MPVAVVYLLEMVHIKEQQDSTLLLFQPAVYLLFRGPAIVKSRQPVPLHQLAQAPVFLLEPHGIQFHTQPPIPARPLSAPFYGYSYIIAEIPPVFQRIFLKSVVFL